MNGSTSNSKGLATEIGKKHRFDSAEQEAYLNVMRTAHLLEGVVHVFLKKHDLTESAYNVLRILRGSGPSGRRVSAIGCDMVVRVPDVTRLLDRLHAKGLVSRTREDGDRRVVIAKITPMGETLLAELDDPILEVHHRQLGHLSPAELEELSRLMVKAREGLKEICDEMKD